MNEEKGELEMLPLAAFSLSCLGALSFGLLAVPGVICGHLARGGKSPRGKALSGAALIVGYSVLTLFFGLPLLILGGLFLLSRPITGQPSQGFSFSFPGSDAFGQAPARNAFEPGLVESFNAYFAHHGSFFVACGVALVILALIPVGVPPLARWSQRRQLRKLVAMNRSR